MDNFYYVRNMSTGKITEVTSSEAGLNGFLQSITNSYPGVEFWVYEKRFTAKAEIPVTITEVSSFSNKEQAEEKTET